MIAELDFFLKYNELNDLLLQCVAGLNNLRFRDFFFFFVNNPSIETSVARLHPQNTRNR